jgi:tetratricopeptide (TPR) repeat protein
LILLGSLTGLASACTPILPPPVVAPPPTATDPLAPVTDVPGLTAAAERLCGPLATGPERELGLRAATRAVERDGRERAAALALARCAYRVADFEPLGERRLAVTQAGLDALAAVAGTGDATVAYYQGVNLGLSLRERGLDAVARVGELLGILEQAAKEPDQDEGGPLRVLGMLYLRAPPWPAGPGDLEAALDLLAQAAAKFPSHPANHLFYATALVEAGEKDRAAAELALAQNLAEPALWGDYAGLWRAEVDALRRKLD